MFFLFAFLFISKNCEVRQAFYKKKVLTSIPAKTSLGLKLSLAILELKEKMQESSGMKQTKQAG